MVWDLTVESIDNGWLSWAQDLLIFFLYPTYDRTLIILWAVIIFHWQNGRLEYDEDIDPFKGKSEEEVQQIQREKEAKANAQILEMVRYFM
mgnify:FL=1